MFVLRRKEKSKDFKGHYNVQMLNLKDPIYIEVYYFDR